MCSCSINSLSKETASLSIGRRYCSSSIQVFYNSKEIPTAVKSLVILCHLGEPKLKSWSGYLSPSGDMLVRYLKSSVSYLLITLSFIII